MMSELYGFSGNGVSEGINHVELRCNIFFQIFKYAALGLAILMNHIDHVSRRTQKKTCSNKFLSHLILRFVRKLDALRCIR